MGTSVMLCSTGPGVEIIMGCGGSTPDIETGIVEIPSPPQSSSSSPCEEEVSHSEDTKEDDFDEDEGVEFVTAEIKVEDEELLVEDSWKSLEEIKADEMAKSMEHKSDNEQDVNMGTETVESTEEVEEDNQEEKEGSSPSEAENNASDGDDEQSKTESPTPGTDQETL